MAVGLAEVASGEATDSAADSISLADRTISVGLVCPESVRHSAGFQAMQPNSGELAIPAEEQAWADDVQGCGSGRGVSGPRSSVAARLRFLKDRQLRSQPCRSTRSDLQQRQE